MKILAIDYGLKKIGLALTEGDLAEPLSVISHQPSVFKKISGICQKHGVEKIVIGLPEGKMVKKVKEFGQKVAKLTGLPVIFQDETLTSKEAIAKMIEAGRGRKTRREKEDAIAAAIILQTYLNSHV